MDRPRSTPQLALCRIEAPETPQVLAQQLPLLTALRELELIGLGFRSVPQPSLQPLVDAVAGMGSLRSLSFALDAQGRAGLDAQQRAQLQGMMQLTQLVTAA
jgi:hypothetical protein